MACRGGKPIDISSWHGRAGLHRRRARVLLRLHSRCRAVPRALCGLTRANAGSRPASLSGGRLRLCWRQSAGMVEQRSIRRALHLEFAFDRLRNAKLKLAYDILVPDRVWIVGSAKLTGG